MKIGIFDSGLGGLTILKGLLLRLPQYDYMYLGDNARVPYGGRSIDAIHAFTVQAIDFLFKHDCRIIIIACNTATAAALRKIQQEYLPKQYPDRKVLGVIRPTVEAVVSSGVKRVGVMGTRATIQSESFVKEILKLSPGVSVIQNAGPLLVPFIEEGEIEHKAFRQVLSVYVQPFLEAKAQALILACTHYGLVKKQIEHLVGNTIRVISEEAIVSQKFEQYLVRHPEIETTLGKNGKRMYCVTDINERYERLVRLFLDGFWKKEDVLRLVSI